MSAFKSLARRTARKLKGLLPKAPLPRPPSVALTIVAQADPVVCDAWHAPAFGAVFDDQGRVLEPTIRPALSYTPTLAALPNAWREGETTQFELPIEALQIPRATVFVSWAGLHNYASFLLNDLPVLVAAEQAGALATHPPIAPPLLPWQAQLLDLTLGGAVKPTVVEAPIVRLGEAVRHAPDLALARERMLTHVAVPDDPGAPKRIYVSRRGALKDELLNEAALEAALEARGFMIVRPEVWSIRDQIILFHRANVVVGATGVAMANVFFCRPGTKVVEIQPDGLAGDWVRDLARRGGGEARAFAAPALPDDTEILIEGLSLPASEFTWRLDLGAFLSFLDEAL
uniref:glycosyltransferase family 61 protein n=1 Tax=uncultured Caulobacter sp. TaxID=158749 RepID=UPI0025F75608|nr:glycosyltransferase 61 family protein [uncultured Caulobacter sp.]